MKSEKQTYESIKKINQELQEKIYRLEKRNTELKNGQDRSDYLLKHAPSHLIVIDLEGTILYANHIISDISNKDLVNTSIFNYIPVTSHYVMVQSMATVLKTQKPDVFEIPIYSAHGMTTWWSNRIGPVKKNEDITEFLIIGTDITEQKQATEAILESEYRFRLLFDKAPLAYQSLNINGYILDVNEAWLRLTGYEREQVIGKNFLEFLNHEAKAHFKALLPRITSVDDSVSSEFRMIKKDGSYIIVTLNSNVSYNEKRVFKQTHCILYDITEQKRMEVALRNSEEKYRQLFEMESDALFLIDKATDQILETNTACTKLYQYERDELLRMKYKDLFFNRLGTMGTHYVHHNQDRVMYHVKKNKTVFPVEITDRSFMLHSRPAVVAAVRDATDRMKAQEEIEKQRIFFKKIIDTSPNYIFVKNSEGRIILANRTLAERMNLSLDATGAKTEYHQISDTHVMIDQGEDDIAIFDKKTERIEREEQFVDGFNEKRWHHTIKLPIKNGHGEVEQLLSISTDITDRKKTEKELQRAYSEMEKRVNERTEELLKANQQLEQKMNEQKHAKKYIQVLTQELIKAQENERQRIALELHDHVAQDLSSLKILSDTFFNQEDVISDEIRQKTAKFSKILQESIQAIRNLSYDLRPILDQLGLVHTIYQFCENFSKTNGIKIDFYTAGIEETLLDFDTEINLYRLIQESLNNVKKHAQAEHVTIRLLASSPDIILRIEDNGTGFNLENRLNDAMREKRMGVRNMEQRVNLLNGTMRMVSHPGGGTKILVKVPIPNPQA